MTDLLNLQKQTSPLQWPPAGVKWYYSDDAVAIAHADCRDILHELPKVDLVLTDPPYGIDFHSGWGGLHGDCAISGDCDTSLRDDVMAQLNGLPFIIFGTWRITKPLNTKTILIWDKGEHSGMGDLSLPWKQTTEEIYLSGNCFCGGHRGSNILRYCNHPTFNASRCHPFEKPIELVNYLVAHTTANLILDPFMGSGTTLRAAKNLGRKAIGIEIEEKYCEIAAKRMSQAVMDLHI